MRIQESVPGHPLFPISSCHKAILDFTRPSLWESGCGKCVAVALRALYLISCTWALTITIDLGRLLIYKLSAPSLSLDEEAYVETISQDIKNSLNHLKELLTALTPENLVQIKSLAANAIEFEAIDPSIQALLDNDFLKMITLSSICSGNKHLKKESPESLLHLFFLLKLEKQSLPRILEENPLSKEIIGRLFKAKNQGDDSPLACKMAKIFHLPRLQELVAIEIHDIKTTFKNTLTSWKELLHTKDLNDTTRQIVYSLSMYRTMSTCQNVFRDILSKRYPHGQAPILTEFMNLVFSRKEKDPLGLSKKVCQLIEQNNYHFGKSLVHYKDAKEDCFIYDYSFFSFARELNPFQAFLIHGLWRGDVQIVLPKPSNDGCVLLSQGPGISNYDWSTATLADFYSDEEKDLPKVSLFYSKLESAASLICGFYDTGLLRNETLLKLALQKIAEKHPKEDFDAFVEKATIQNNSKRGFGDFIRICNDVQSTLPSSSLEGASSAEQDAYKKPGSDIHDLFTLDLSLDPKDTWPIASPLLAEEL